MKNQRDKEIVSVGGALQKMLKEYSLDKKFHKSELIQAWPAIVGPAIAAKTGRIFIKGGIFFIEIMSAPLRNELNNNRSLLLKRVVDQFGEGIISEIKFF